MNQLWKLVNILFYFCVIKEILNKIRIEILKYFDIKVARVAYPTIRRVILVQA